MNNMKCLNRLLGVWGFIGVTLLSLLHAHSTEVYERKWSESELRDAMEQQQQWLNNDLGKSRYAPAPWTPMRIEGEAIHSWGKVYRYDRSLFPVSMTTQGKELLGGRTVIKIRANGTWLVFDQAEVKIHQQYDGEVEVQTVAEQEGVRVQTDVVYEFDGMGKVSLRISGDRSKEVSAIYLEVPLVGEQSLLYHYAGSRFNIEVNGEKIRGAALPPLSDSGWVNDLGTKLDAFREILWFGDQDVGWSWFADGMQGWPVKDEQDIQQIGPLQDGNRLITIKLGDKPVRLEQPLEMIFGIQATPMKPRGQDFRSRVGWEKRSNPVFDWQWRWGDGYYYPFQESYPEKAREDVNQRRAAGMEVLPCSSLEYFGAYRFSKGKFGLVQDPGLKHREVLLWGEHWDQKRQFAGSASEAEQIKQHSATLRRNGKIPGNTLEQVRALPRHTAPGEDWYGELWKPTSYPERFCYNSSFQDFYLWKLHQLVEQTGLGAIYLDQQLYECADPAHGCGYTNAQGKWMGQGGVFAMREMMKRMYFIFYELNDNVPPQIMWHCSQQMVIPAMSFIDIFWDGEKYVTPGLERSIVGHEFYSEVLDEAVMQVQHTGRQFGFIADFLPQLTRAELRSLPITSPTVASVRDMMGLLMIHDSHIDGYGSLTYHPDLVAHIVNKRRSYPLDEMEVVYYWQKQSGIEVNDERVKYILHHREGEALLILFNWGDNPVSATVEVDLQQLGYPAAMIDAVHAKDAFTKMKEQSVGSTLTLDLLPRDFRMLELRWAKHGLTTERN